MPLLLFLAGCGGASSKPYIPAYCVGDSLTYGVGSSGGYPKSLPFATVNSGVRGDTTSGVTARVSGFKQADIVFLMIGHNDKDWLNAEAKYTALADKVFTQKPWVKVYWANVILDRDGAYLAQCEFQDAALRKVVARQRSLGRDVTFVDAYHQTYTYSDHVHLDEAGYKTLARVFMDAME